MVLSTNEVRSEVAERAAVLASLPWYVRLLVNQSSLGFNAGDTNLYRYVSNGPTNATDPSGLVLQWVFSLLPPRPQGSDRDGWAVTWNGVGVGDPDGIFVQRYQLDGGGGIDD